MNEDLTLIMVWLLAPVWNLCNWNLAAGVPVPQLAVWGKLTIFRGKSGAARVVLHGRPEGSCRLREEAATRTPPGQLPPCVRRLAGPGKEAPHPSAPRQTVCEEPVTGCGGRGTFPRPLRSARPFGRKNQLTFPATGP